jgi:hypothetical protein
MRNDDDDFEQVGDDDYERDSDSYGPGGGYAPGVGGDGPEYDDGGVKDADANMPPGAMALHGVADAYKSVLDRLRHHMGMVENPGVCKALDRLHDQAQDRLAHIVETHAAVYPDHPPIADHDSPEDDLDDDADLDEAYMPADEERPLDDQKRRGYRRKSLDALSDEELLAEEESLLREYRHEASEFAEGL